MQPVVQATTRTPGPSTVEPVVNEWRNPMSPVASAVWTSAWDTLVPRLTRSSYGLAASSAVGPASIPSSMATASVEGAVDHVQLLLTREPHEIHGIPGHADG